MNILLTGGTGMLGRSVAAEALTAGYGVRIMSRRPRPDESPFDWARADLESGEGLPEAVDGVDTIVHAATNPGPRSRKVDVQGTERLLDAAGSAGVSHVIFPSIVGVDRVPFSYYRQKLEAERLIARSGLPHTILRATQFHGFIHSLLSGLRRLPFVLPLPTEVPIQSVDSTEVAARLVAIVDEGPGGRLPDFGGPEITPLGDIARSWLEKTGIRRRVVGLPVPGKTAKAFRRGGHTNPDRKVGRVRWQEWLEHGEDSRAGS